MQNELVLFSKRPEDQEFAHIISENLSFNLHQTTDPSELAQFISEKENIPVLIDASTESLYQAFESAIQDSIGLFSEKINPNQLHFLCDENLEKVKYLTQSPLFGNFLFRNTTDTALNAHQYTRILQASLAPRAFGLTQVLKPGTQIQSIQIKNSAQKQEAVEAVKGFLTAAQFQSRAITVIINAVDELLMNAIFDAPVDSFGKPTLVSTPRTTAVALEGKSKVEMFLGYDGEQVAISTIDLFGSLDKEKLIYHLAKVYSHEEYRVREGTAGAGIGLSTIFRSGGSFLFACEAKTRTEVTTFFRRGVNFRDFKNQFRFVSTQFYF